jgi:hypothetical protein
MFNKMPDTSNYRKSANRGARDCQGSTLGAAVLGKFAYGPSLWSMIHQGLVAMDSQWQKDGDKEISSF